MLAALLGSSAVLSTVVIHNGYVNSRNRCSYLIKAEQNRALAQQTAPNTVAIERRHLTNTIIAICIQLLIVGAFYGIQNILWYIYRSNSLYPSIIGAGIASSICLIVK